MGRAEPPSRPECLRCPGLHDVFDLSVTASRLTSASRPDTAAVRRTARDLQVRIGAPMRHSSSAISAFTMWSLSSSHARLASCFDAKWCAAIAVSMPFEEISFHR